MGNSQVQCDLCGSTFKNKGYLSAHTRRIHGTMAAKGSSHACPDCELPYDTPRSLQRHRDQMHRAKMQHRCQHCRCSFAQAQSLLQHLRKAHQFDEAHDRLFGTDLEAAVSEVPAGHVTSVAGQAVFSCEVCGKLFENEKSYRLHWRMSHRGATRSALQEDTILFKEGDKEAVLVKRCDPGAVLEDEEAGSGAIVIHEGDILALQDQPAATGQLEGSAPSHSGEAIFLVHTNKGTVITQVGK